MIVAKEMRIEICHLIKKFLIDIYHRKLEKIKSLPSADESEHPTHITSWLVSIWVKIGTKKGTIKLPEMFCKVGETDAI